LQTNKETKKQTDRREDQQTSTTNYNHDLQFMWHVAKDKLTSYDGGNIEIEGKCIVRITKPDAPGKSYPVQCFVVLLNYPQY
jgi:hypothetical protein